MTININFKVAGRYKIHLKDSLGNITKELDWFDNLVTNQGLDFMGAGVTDYNPPVSMNNYITRCAVGTSNTTPAFTDTTLGSQLAAFPAYGSQCVFDLFSPTYVAGPPAYFTASHTFTFPLGGVVGNIAEIGVGYLPVGATAGTPVSLFSHALIMSGGTPTTISVTGSDQLVVTFELRWYINTTSSPYSVTISGTSYTGNMLSLTQTLTTAFSLNCAVDMNNPSVNNTRCYCFNGSIVGVTSLPSGTSADIGQSTIPSYSLGTYTKSYTFNATTSTGNLTGGISVVAIQMCYQGWQFSISPSIPKDNTKTMSLSFSVSWTRYP